MINLDMTQYFSRKQGESFKNELPKLRGKIGTKPLPSSTQGLHYGVAANTFRALTNYKEKPSEIYREWADSTYASLDTSKLLNYLACENNFKVWHQELADALLDYWYFRQERHLLFAHQYKLIDLFIKWLSQYNFQSPDVSDGFINHANCALDSQSLVSLSKCFSYALPISKPTMRDIHCDKTYEFCQNLISIFSRQYSGSRLLFDFYSWKPGGIKVIE